MYLRRLTMVWACFFVINGCIALATVQMSMQAWGLYNGFIAYLAIGGLLGGEWLFRRWYKQRKGVAVDGNNACPLGDVLAAEYRPEFVGVEPRVDGCRLHLQINPGLAWFEGHFPDQPVLPGVVQLHWAILAAMQLPGIEGLPTAIRRLKFRHMLVPPAPVTLELARSGDIVSFSYHWQDTEYSNGRLHFGT
jgi:hypothetical protein